MLLTLALIFVCGAACGLALTREFLHSGTHSSARPATPAIERARNVGLTNLKAKLGLSTAQEQTVTKILDDYGKFYQNIEDEREDVAADGTRRILDALTPGQRERFNKLITQTAR